jgi:hypothetical protein
MLSPFDVFRPFEPFRTGGVGAPADTAHALLLESGVPLLLETGDPLLLEADD